LCWRSRWDSGWLRPQCFPRPPKSHPDRRKDGETFDDPIVTESVPRRRDFVIETVTADPGTGRLVRVIARMVAGRKEIVLRAVVSDRAAIETATGTAGRGTVVRESLRDRKT